VVIADMKVVPSNEKLTFSDSRANRVKTVQRAQIQFSRIKFSLSRQLDSPTSFANLID